MNKIVKILIERDGMTAEDAMDLLEECRDQVKQGENPEDVLLNDLGLEPDYILDLFI